MKINEVYWATILTRIPTLNLKSNLYIVQTATLNAICKINCQGGGSGRTIEKGT